MPTRLLHLVGSPGNPFLRDLSALYARDCLAETHDPARWEHDVAYVDEGGTWRFPGSLDPDAIERAEPFELGTAVARIEALAPAAMVPHMFCRPGMTHYRALFDVLGIPYVGNPPEAMAAAADKARARALVAAAGVAVPDGMVVRDERKVPDPFRAGVVVKPTDADNSLGVSLVRSPEELPAAVDAALEHGSGALVERYVELGREVRCGVIERAGDLVVLPLEEYAVDPFAKPIRDHADKIRSSDGGLALAAKDAEHAWTVSGGDPVNAAVGVAARRAHEALGCRHYGLFDFRVDPDGEPWFLEASLYCSFARQSVLSTMARAGGTPTADLFAELLATVLEPVEAPQWM